jgi:hypothetical protein
MPLSDKRRSRNVENAFRVAEFAWKLIVKSSIDGALQRASASSEEMPNSRQFSVQLFEC